jgi:hypothetical protein
MPAINKNTTPPSTPDKPIKIDKKHLFAPIRKTVRTTYIDQISNPIKKLQF